jgi:hypothetical protein
VSAKTQRRWAAVSRNLDRNLDRARDLDRAITRGIRFARHLGVDLDPVLMLDRNLIRRLEQPHAVDLDRVSDLPYARDCARALVAPLVHARNLAFDRAGTLDRDLHCALALECSFDFDLARACDLDAKLHCASRLVSILDLASKLARELVRDLGRDLVRASAFRQAAHPGQAERAAAGLAAAAARLIPAGSQARYAEEYLVELRDMASAGAGLKGQLGYGLRLLIRSPLLRTELRAARRRGAVS